MSLINLTFNITVKDNMTESIQAIADAVNTLVAGDQAISATLASVQADLATIGTAIATT